MSYAERFDRMVASAVKGYAIGLVMAAGFGILVWGGDIGLLLAVVPLFTLIFGSAASIVVGSEGRDQLGGACRQLFSGVLTTILGGIASVNIPLITIGIIKMMFSLVVLIPVLLHMVFSYIIEFIYLGIMKRKEMGNRLAGSEESCRMMDARIEMASKVLTGICILFLLMRFVF